MHYIEYATSAGPGTLIEHGVGNVYNPGQDVELEGKTFIVESITHERYVEFIAIHDSERAIP